MTAKTKSKTQKELKNLSLIEQILTKDGVNEYKQTIHEALGVLKKKNLALIVHGSSFPSLPEEDTGIGSPFTSGAMGFLKFIDTLGFNSTQLGPSGLTKENSPSPYTSTIFSYNTLFIDLMPLTTPEWFSLLSEKTYHNIVKNNKYRNKAWLNYEYIYKKQDIALHESWNNYQSLLSSKKDLDKEDKKRFKEFRDGFESFKKDSTWLESDALYHALSIINADEYWPNWSDLDKHLPAFLKSQDSVLKERAENRLNEILSQQDYMNEMEYYKFCQYIAELQKDNTNKTAPIHSIADMQVTYSDRDWWANQDLFLKNYWLGVPPDYFSTSGQAWGFPVLDPAQLFIKTKSGKKEPGKVSKLIRLRCDKMFKDNPGGVRIDHVIGLIDPWVYPVTSRSARTQDGGKRLYSSPEVKEFKTWSRVNIKDINYDEPPESERRVKNSAMTQERIDKYAEVLDIFVQSAKDNNVQISNIICEDLGTLTNPVIKVLANRKLSGIRVTQFVNPNDETHLYRGKNVQSKHWITAGTHDNPSLLGWINSLRTDKSFKKHARALCEDILPIKDSELKEKEVEKYCKEMVKDETNIKFLKAKLAELFTSPAQNVQLMFLDLFGIEERYNTPGTTDPKIEAKNWRLRVPNNYQEEYFKNVAEGRACNLPEVLAMAIRAHTKDQKEKHSALLQNLDIFACKFATYKID